MKHLVILMICVASFLPVWSQTGLNVNALFDGRYRKSPNAVEILVRGEEARKIGLTTYRSLSLSSDVKETERIESIVTKDGATAVDKEVEYRGGKLYYGFYTLKPVYVNGRQLNRYLFYLNQNLNNRNPVDKVTVIYMEGRASSKYIKQLIRN